MGLCLSYTALTVGLLAEDFLNSKINASPINSGHMTLWASGLSLGIQIGAGGTAKLA